MIAGSRLAVDPRRKGLHPMLAVLCWCGRFFTVTPEEARRKTLEVRFGCPECAP